MGLEIFEDPVGESIKARLMNFAAQKNKKPFHKIEPSVNRLSEVVSLTREAIEDCLDAEIGVFSSRGYEGDPIPVLFLAGLAHALDVIKGQASIIGKDQ